MNQLLDSLGSKAGVDRTIMLSSSSLVKFSEMKACVLNRCSWPMELKRGKRRRWVVLKLIVLKKEVVVEHLLMLFRLFAIRLLICACWPMF